MMLVVYGLHGGAELGWDSLSTLALLGSGTILLIAFAWVESRARAAMEPVATVQDGAVSPSDAIAVFAVGESDADAHHYLAGLASAPARISSHRT
jgi:hypothetical protein